MFIPQLFGIIGHKIFMCNADMTEYDPDDLFDDKYLLEAKFLFVFSFIFYFSFKTRKASLYCYFDNQPQCFSLCGLF